MTTPETRIGCVQHDCAECQARKMAADGALPIVDDGWHMGAPPAPFNDEWFIAILTGGSRVVLRALPDEFTYDFKTADETYYMAYRVEKWMQFPDSEYVPFSQSTDKEAADGAQGESKPVDEMALGFAIMEHLGPAALTGGRISPIDSFTLGWNAAMLAADGAQPTFTGPAKWTDEEVEQGHVGIRWINRNGVQGRPTPSDVRRYLSSRDDDGAQSEPTDHCEDILHMVTDLEITELAHRTAWDYEHNAFSGSHMYTFNTHTLIDFARKLLKGGAQSEPIWSSSAECELRCTKPEHCRDADQCTIDLTLLAKGGAK